jgi:uncharacterized protein (DUF427 family)
MPRYQAVFHDEVIADTEDAVLLEGNVYFPLAAVRPDILRPSHAKSLCFWKGIATYYTVEVDGARDRSAAWTYRHPSPLARSIKNRVAFWGNVHVEPVEAPAR